MKQIQLVPITFDIGRLKPAISEIGFDMHYNKVYKPHVDNFNKQRGDIAFHKAGATLNGLYFENIREYRQDNRPIGRAADVIDKRYGGYENFCHSTIDQMVRLQGSGWIFMNNAGYINIVPNNRIVDNIALIISFWEHAYCFTHGVDRLTWLKNAMSIVNWDVVNQRLNKE